MPAEATSPYKTYRIGEWARRYYPKTTADVIAQLAEIFARQATLRQPEFTTQFFQYPNRGRSMMVEPQPMDWIIAPWRRVPRGPQRFLEL